MQGLQVNARSALLPVSYFEISLALLKCHSKYFQALSSVVVTSTPRIRKA
jgi:hypothetical protein